MSRRTAECLESFERRQALNSLRKFDTRLDISRLDYREVSIQDGDVVYCDIPYRSSSEQYNRMNGVPPFDYDAFYVWAKEQRVPVYISEYEMPTDFICVAETERCGHMAANNNANRKIERLFVARF